MKIFQRTAPLLWAGVISISAALGQEETNAKVLRRLNLNPGLIGSQLANMRVTRLIAHGDNFTFHVAPGTSTQNGYLVRSDREGSVRWARPLGDDEVLDIILDAAGDPVVLSAPITDSARVTRFGPDGTLRGDPLPFPGIAKLARLGETIIGVAGSGAVRSLGANAPPITARFALKPSNEFLVVSLGNGEIASIDQIDAGITVINPRLGLKRDFKLDHQEVTRVKAQYQSEAAARPSLHGQTIVAVAADPGQRIYCMLSGFSAHKGAPVVVLDSTGWILKTFRCPVIGDNERKWAVPVSISVDSGQLFMADADNLVWIYDVNF
jgi:hypothetical protein